LIDDDDGDDEEIIDAEVVDEPPKRCPKCESFDIGRGKIFAGFAVIIVTMIGAAVAVDQLALAFFITALLLVLYYVMPAFRCRDCGARFD
jgi:hypothetical protein